MLGTLRKWVRGTGCVVLRCHVRELRRWHGHDGRDYQRERMLPRPVSVLVFLMPEGNGIRRLYRQKKASGIPCGQKTEIFQPYEKPDNGISCLTDRKNDGCAKEIAFYYQCGIVNLNIRSEYLTAECCIFSTVNIRLIELNMLASYPELMTSLYNLQEQSDAVASSGFAMLIDVYK